jgi:hypothetical protein
MGTVDQLNASLQVLLYPLTVVGVLAVGFFLLKRAWGANSKSVADADANGFIPDSRRDRFESDFESLRASKDSRVKIDFRKTKRGDYIDPHTRNAFNSFNAAPEHKRSSDDFMLSLMVGYATESTMLGYMAGGSFTGGMLGSSMSSKKHHTERGDSTHSSSWSSNDVATSRVDDGDSYTPSARSSSVESCLASDYSTPSESASSSSSSDSSSSSSSSSE